ncbi:hypothetical protein Tco_1087686, partial [Tanacetum coccineum]
DITRLRFTLAGDPRPGMLPCHVPWWYPETFVCLVGLSRSFDDHHVRPTLLKDNKSDMGLLDYVKSVDPSKVKTMERRLAEGEIPLNDETVNMTVAPSAEIIQIVKHTIMGELREHADKKKKKVAFDTLPAKKLRADQVAASEPMAIGSEPESSGMLISSSVTPTPEPNIPEDSGSTHDAAVQTHRASMKVVVYSSSGHDDVDAAPRAEPHVEVKDIATGS